MTRLPRWTSAAAAVFVGSLALIGAARAQSNVQIYGLVDMSAGKFQLSGAPGIYRLDSGNMTTSFLGFKGTEDLGGGLKAKFALEHFLRADSGSAGRFNGDAFWSRNAYVGLQGAFGTTTLGRNTTPLFVSALIFNAFGDSFGYSPTIRQIFTPSLRAFQGDSGWNNSLAYTSDNMGGTTVSVIGSLGEGAAGAVGKNIGGNVLYFTGPFAATVAAQRVKNGLINAPAGFKSQDTINAGVSYDLSVVKLFGQYTQVKTKANQPTKTSIGGLGLSAPIGPGKVLVQFGSAKATINNLRTTHKVLTTGYDYNVSKSTDLYALYMYDKVSRLSKGQTVAAGIRLRF